jgi:hypothetical protein
VRLTAVIALALFAACSSGSGAKSTASSATAPTSTTVAANGPSTTVDPALLTSLDEAGAKAFLTLYANQLKELDPAVTQAQIDCVPDAILDRMTPKELFALIDAGLGTLTTEQGAALTGALKACGFTDQQIEKANIR